MKVHINPHGVSLQQLIIATCSTMSTYHQLTLFQCRERASAPSKQPRVDAETDSDSVGAGTASPDSSQLYLQAGLHNQEFKTNFIHFPFTGYDPVATHSSVSDSQKAQ